MIKPQKRINLLVGHYGSGKTNIAVNLAIETAKEAPVIIGDLDIVNPYYRTKDSADDLANAGVELISPPYANTNLDIPAIPSDFYRILNEKDKYVFMDIGGDDQGAVALGRFAPAIAEENNYAMFFVANFSRPLTPTAQDCLEVMKEIEQACSLKCTAIINNTHLGNLTDEACVLDSLAKAEELSALSNLPLVMTTVERSLYDTLSHKITNIFPLNLQKKLF